MHSVFCLQVTVGIVSFDLKGCGFDAGLVSLKKIGDGYLVAVPLSPSGVHSHKHGTPVVGFCSSGSGIDFYQGSKVVSLVGQHTSELNILEVCLQSFFSLGDFFFRGFHFLKHVEVFSLAFKGVQFLYPIFYG